MRFFKFLFFDELLLFDFIKDLFNRSDGPDPARGRGGRKRSAQLQRKLDGVLGSTGFQGVRTEGVPGGVEARWTQDGLQAAVMLKDLTHSGAITTRARFRIEYPPLGLGLKLKPTHPDRRAQTPGELPFHVKAYDTAALDAYLTPERVARLAPLFDQLHKPYVTDTTASFEVPSLPLAASALVQEAAHLSQLAEALVTAQAELAVVGAGDTSGQASTSADPASIGLPASHAAELGSRAAGPESMDSAAADSTDAVPDTSEAPAVDLESVISRWESGAATAAALEGAAAPQDAPAAPAPDVANAPIDAAASDPQSSSLDVQSVTAQLFASNAAKFEVKQRFERDHAGQRVTWRGTLERVETFRSDVVFQGSGTKLTFEMPALEADAPGGIARPCHAIVQLTGNAPGDLEPGTELTFIGTLLDCDPFMRRVFLTAGVLATR